MVVADLSANIVGAARSLLRRGKIGAAISFVVFLAVASIASIATTPSHAVYYRAQASRPPHGHRRAPMRYITYAEPAPKIAPKAKPALPSAFDREQQMSGSELLDRWQPVIVKAASRFGVPQTWIRAVMSAESGGRTMASENQPITSNKGAMGLMQLLPQTYADMRAQYGLGRDPYDPHDNILAGAAYLHWLYDKYGYPAMFAAYNDGPGNLEQRLIDGHLLPLETQLYVGEVTGRLASVHAGGPKVRFTRPNGQGVLIDCYAVSSVRAPVADEYPPDVRAVISVGRLQQGVKETVAQVATILRKHGGRV